MFEKIIFISNGYRGGANKYIQQHIKFIKKEKKYLLDDNPKKNYSNLILQNINWHKVKVLKESFYFKRIITKIIKDDKKNANTLIFITNFAIIFKYLIFFLKLRKKGVKICLTLHSGLLQIKLKNLLAAFVFSFFINIVDVLIFGSNSSKKWWFSFFPWMSLKKNRVIYNGIEKRKINLKKINFNKINVSFIARIERENDPYLFCQIAKSIAKKTKKINFHIYGDGKLKEDITNYNKIIKFHGWSKENIIYKNSDIVLITSYVNNFPYVALEAKSYGLPVISCSKGDIKHIIKNNNDGYLTLKRDTDVICKLILKAVKNYKVLNNNALKNVKQFEVQKSCKKIWRYVLDANNNIR